MSLADTPVAASAAKRPGRSSARFWIAELVPFLVGIAAWQALSSLNVWPRVLFPSPLEVGQAFVEDISTGVLLVNLGTPAAPTARSWSRPVQQTGTCSSSSLAPTSSPG